MADVVFRPEIGLWWPEYDEGWRKCHDWVRGRITAMDHAASLAKRVACIQAGAHVGMWPIRLADIFERVYAFEPDPHCFEAARHNLAGFKNVTLAQFALGAESVPGKMRRAPTAGSWRMDEAGDVDVKVLAIDACQIENVGAIFLDIEGFEIEALRGAARTIKHSRPVLHVEMQARHEAALMAHMASIRYRLVHRVCGDAVFTPEKRR